MSAESGSRKTRATTSQSKDKQDPPAKDGKSGDADPAPKVQELDIQKTKEVKVDPRVFQAVFYMKHFRVTDIVVKLVDRTLIIDASHREHADEHGLISRSVIRKQKLPKDISLESLICSFTGNGFLVIHADFLEKKSKMK